MLSSPLSAQLDLGYEQNKTVTWQEAIQLYSSLDNRYEEARLLEVGTTDAGRPLHLFIISADGVFDPVQVRNSGKRVLFINNGIHPGEPCGVDASLKLADELLSGKDSYSRFLHNTVVVIVPILNVGGALNRSSYHRANQNGPVEHGFRGNARNLDLNRDFVKLDSRNARSLVQVLRKWEPEVFVDTHTSNGADYPYVITLINSHPQRHEPVHKEFLEQTMLPYLFESMADTPYEMSPYVWSIRRSPENGLRAFLDYPRYTSGYASLFNTLAFTVETHMFKPFRDRVLSTWYLLREMLKFTSTHGKELEDAKEKARISKLAREEFTLLWKLDTSRYDWIPFRGYRATTRTGAATGQTQVYYDRSQPWEKEIPYYRYFSPETMVSVPDYYLVPCAWEEVVHRLRLNRVEMIPVPSDTLIEAEVYYIDDLKTSERPYNGHYRHSDIRVRSERERVRLLKGDYIIPTRQEAIEYLVQTLEPQGYDSFFSWNFFDEILFRNEYFSPYIFEDTAATLLEKDPDLKQAFEQRKKEDSEFSSSAYLQLRFLYENSPWSEPSYRRYPVYRIDSSTVEPLFFPFLL